MKPVFELGKKHRKALEVLDYECRYEDARSGGRNNFISASKFPRGVGDGTRKDLVDWGLAVAGPCRRHDETGHRITDAGRTALELPPPAKKPRTPPRLHTLKPGLSTLPPRIKTLR